MRPPARINSRAARAAPFLSAVALIALCLHGLGVQRQPADTKYLARVAAAIDAIPYRIGPLVGTDAAPTPAAVRLLKPNRILQRCYTDPQTGASLTLLLVHCADVRDMLGHYPPVCYPAHGWLMDDSAAVDIAIEGSHAPARLYQFSRSGDDIDQRMSVLSFFVLPGSDSPVVADMDALVRAARSPGAAGLGAAQVQIVATRSLIQGAQADLTDIALRAIEPSIRTIAGGPHS